MKFRQGITAFILALAWMAAPAFAADKGGPNFLDIPGATPKSVWTGLGFGAYGSMLNGDVDLGPINLGANGNEAGLALSYDVAMGAFLIGAGVEYGRVFGDLHNIGVDANLAVFGRAGVFATASTLMYLRVGRSRLDTAAGNLDGWQWGGGFEIKMPTAPVFLKLEALKGTYDLSDIGGPPVDAEITTVRLGVTYKLN